MTLEQKEAKKILNDFINILGDDSVGKAYAKDCALISVDNEYNVIIHVIGELKARGELSEKIYLKYLKDLNLERIKVKEAIEKL